MNWKAALHPVLNRGSAKTDFLDEMTLFVKDAPESLFAHNQADDIYAACSAELGPWLTILARKAAMLTCLSVLSLFESSQKWSEGADTTNPSEDNPDTMSAGPFQLAYNSRSFGSDLRTMITEAGIKNGDEFQNAMKTNRPFTFEYTIRLVRITRKHNGPLYKGHERSAFHGAQQQQDHSIYPWLRRDAMAEFAANLA